MKFTGRVQAVSKDWRSDFYTITLSVNEKSALPEVDAIKDKERLSIEIKEYRPKRSLDANALLWACLSEIAVALWASKRTFCCQFDIDCLHLHLHSPSFLLKSRLADST